MLLMPNSNLPEAWSLKYPPSHIKHVPSWLHQRAVWDHSEWLHARTGSLWAGLSCNGCDKAFSRQTVAWYKVRRLIEYVEYPDLQFYRFGQLCLECRNPYHGEGHFVVEVEQLKKVEDLSAQMDKSLPVAIQSIVFGYYEKRTVPDYPTLKDVQKFRKIDDPGRGVATGLPRLQHDDPVRGVATGLTRLQHDKHDALMSFPGVERVFRGGVYLDMRWFVPVQCMGPPICTAFPCSCLSSAEQVENIRTKFGEAWPYGHGEGQQAIELLRIEGLPLPAYVVVLTDVPNLFHGRSRDLHRKGDGWDFAKDCRC